MKLQLFLWIGLLITACNAPSNPPAGKASGPWYNGKLVDLTHAFDSSTIYWPTEKGFVLENEFEGRTEGGYWYESNAFYSAEHGGTHLDAPVHFAEGRQSVDEIPLANLIGPAIVIDIRDKCRENTDYQVAVADIQSWEEQNGQIPDGTIILFMSGYSSRWSDRKAYLGTDEYGPDAVAKLHFPGIHPDAARWLVENRKIHAVGIDTPSIDFGQSTRFETHQVLYSENIPGFENVANLDQLPAKGFSVIALPMKIRSGSGGPLRIVAVIP